VFLDQIHKPGVIGQGDTVNQFAGHASGIHVWLQREHTEFGSGLSHTALDGTAFGGSVNAIFYQQQGMARLRHAQAGVQRIGIEG